jgi:GH24 family phage-related lysozyme (muramidase)
MKWYYWIIIFVVIAIILVGNTYRSILSDFIPTVEGFRSNPYWDKKQWTWGYGTKVTGSIDNPNVKPNKTITRNEAFKEMMKDLDYRHNYLKPKLRALSNKEWAAILSFAYNEGVGAADKLVNEINNKSDSLQSHWKEYIYAGGLVSNDLIARRNKEWNLFIS